MSDDFFADAAKDDAITALRDRLAALRQELRVAESFHAVAVKERNAAWGELTVLRQRQAETCDNCAHRVGRFYCCGLHGNEEYTLMCADAGNFCGAWKEAKRR